MWLHGMLWQVAVDKKRMARKNNNRANQTTLTRWDIFKFSTNDDITNHEQFEIFQPFESISMQVHHYWFSQALHYA